MSKGRFRYPRWSGIAQIKGFPVILFFLIPCITVWFVALLGPDLTLDRRAKWFFAGCFFFGVMAWVINLFPEVWVKGNKIGIQHFIFWWKWIDLDDLVSISKRSAGGEGPVWVVEVQKLGLLHRLYGLYHARIGSPVFLISVDMLGFQELVSLIENHISVKNDS